MADAVELAVAYIQIVPSMDGSREAITKEIVPASEGAGEEAGEKAGVSFGAKMTAALGALAIGAVISDAITESMNLDGAVRKVSAGMGMTTVESERLGRVAGELWASAYGESSADAANAVGAVLTSIEGMSEASDADLQALTGQVMSLAEAFDMDVSEAALVAGQMISSGLADDGAGAVDLLAASLQEVPAALRGDVIDAAKEYGGYLSELGLTGEEAMGALVAASDGGTIAIDKTGDALKELSIRATDMSTASVAAYEAAGLNAEEMSAAFLAGGDTARGALDQLVDGLLGIQDPTERANAAIALFGTPLEDLGVTQIPTFLSGLQTMGGELGTVDGAAATLDETLNGGMGTSLEALKNSFMLAVMEGIQPFLSAAQPLIDWLAANPVVVQVAAAAFGVLAIGLGAAAAATWVMNSALLANPITWVVVAVVALIAAIVALAMNWESVSAWLSGAWNATVSAVGNAFVWLGQLVASIGVAIVSAVTAAWNWVVSLMMSAGAKITAGMSAAWNAVKSATSTAITAVVGFVASLPGKAASAISSFTSAVVSVAKRAWELFKSTTTAGISAVVGFVRGLPGKAMSALSSLAGSLRNVATNAWNGFKSAVTAGINAAVGLVRGLPGKIVGVLSGLGGRLVSSGRSMLEGFARGIRDGFSRAVSAVSDGIAKVRSFFPFSPAKEGPLSGRGYVTYSADALTSDFAKHIESGASKIRSAAKTATSAAVLGGSYSTKAGMPAPAGGATFHIGRIELPNVSDVEDFVRELQRLPLRAHMMGGIA